jgi:hypothetical protein
LEANFYVLNVEAEPKKADVQLLSGMLTAFSCLAREKLYSGIGPAFYRVGGNQVRRNYLCCHRLWRYWFASSFIHFSHPKTSFLLFSPRRRGTPPHTGHDSSAAPLPTPAAAARRLPSPRLHWPRQPGGSRPHAGHGSPVTPLPTPPPAVAARQLPSPHRPWQSSDSPPHTGHDSLAV